MEVYLKRNWHMLVYFIVKMMMLKCGFHISFIFSITDLISMLKDVRTFIAYWLLV